MAEPNTSYICIRSREMVRNREVYNKKGHFYTGLMYCSQLEKIAAGAGTGSACN